MKQQIARRFEELFKAEMILRRVYLHLCERETIDIAAQMLVVIRYEEITREQARLKRAVRRAAV